MLFKSCSLFKTVRKTSSLVSEISSKFRFLASLYVISRMICVSADRFSASAKTDFRTKTTVLEGYLTYQFR